MSNPTISHVCVEYGGSGVLRAADIPIGFVPTIGQTVNYGKRLDDDGVYFVVRWFIVECDSSGSWRYHIFASASDSSGNKIKWEDNDAASAKCDRWISEYEELGFKE